MEITHQPPIKSIRRNSVGMQRKENSMQSIEFHFNQEQIDLIKSMLCPTITDDELKLFAHTCKRTGLDPLLKQIYPVKRWNAAQGKHVMTIQTAIDGYRLIAERSGKYSPGRDAEYGYDDNGKLKWAKAFIKKMTPDGTWHEISSTAFWDEYVQTTKQGIQTQFWKSKAHIMLSKCAESLALRKAFPAELSALRTDDEMKQADNPSMEEEEKESTCDKVENTVEEPNEPNFHREENTVSLCEDEVNEIENLIGDDEERREAVLYFIEKRFKVTQFNQLEKEEKNWLCGRLKESNERALQLENDAQEVVG